MNDLPLWIAVTVVWLLAIFVFLIVVPILNSIWLICLIDVALTIGLVATLAYIRSWNPHENVANSELLIVFMMMGIIVVVTFVCVAIMQIGGWL